MDVKARMFKNNRQVMLYLDIKGTSDLDCPYIDIDTGWVNRIFKRTFEGSCCAEYILTSRKPMKNNRRELVNNPEDQLLDFDTVRETVFGMKKELNIDESINVKFDYEIIGGS